MGAGGVSGECVGAVRVLVMLSKLDRFWIALTSIGLGALILGALGIATLILVSGCAHPPPPPVPTEPLYVLVGAHVPGNAWFCVEDPFVDGQLHHPMIRTGVVCRVTVDEMRHWIASLQQAN